jgi:hypothetical protein
VSVCNFHSVLATSNEVNRWFIAVHLRYLYLYLRVIGVYDILLPRTARTRLHTRINIYLYGAVNGNSSLNTDNAILFYLRTTVQHVPPR